MINKKIFADQARTWIGTKFQHQGRLKKNENCNGGCDCLGLLIGVIKELSLEKKISENIDLMDTKNYQRILKTTILIDSIQKYFKQKNINSIEIGDIALFKSKNSIYPHHLGIINKLDENLTLIHSFLNVEAVVEHILDEYWINNIHSIYDFL
jgi:hypothetical protein